MAPDGTRFQIIKHFGCGPLVTDGCVPLAGLIQLGDGFLYGTTSQTLTQGGTVFKVAPDGSGFQVIKAFGTSGTDSLGPMAGLILGGDGFLYGTTNGGGANGGGTVFKVAPDGANFLIIKSFQCGNNAANGCSPQAGLILLSDGFLYGTTNLGGADDQGTVFKIATGW